MAVNNNLFPPMCDTTIPAFLINSGNVLKDTCRVYFSISLYNNLNEIKNAQVTVVGQNTNISVLNKEKYPCEIMLTNIYQDNSKESDDKYYIDIKTSDIQDGFQIDQYYKVQIRFTAADAADISLAVPQAIDSWLAANQALFSEWSSVCLVRGISKPTLNINGFDSTADSTLWSLSNVDIIGTLTFADESENETLKSYQIKLYDEENNLLSDSGELYTNNYGNANQFNYTLKYALKEGNSYYFTFEYVTQTLYKEMRTYEFMVVQETTDSLDATMSAILDEENGRIGINIVGNENNKNFIGNITIRRSSSESNFTIWEDIHTQSFTDSKPLNYIWYDYTIKSGVWYKYCAQRRNSVGARGLTIKLQEEPVMMLFDDMFLNADSKQLNIRFNPSVSSYQRTIAESKTDTIGNKYPYITRNGYMDYRQFPIGGLISCVMDKDNLLTSKEEIFQDSLEDYKDFNEENRINDLNDWTYEREFREKVMDFLYKNNVKLFRSATEGNILVKLMDINLTPEVALGRRIYSFTANAYEIDDCTIENIDKYNIQRIGNYTTLLQYFDDKIGQYNAVAPASKNVIDLIAEQYQKYAKEGYNVKIDNLDFLRIEMESKPYLIIEDAEGPIIANDLDTNDLNNVAVLGYIVYINEVPIVINPEGIYELKGSNIEITSISFPVDTKVILDYHANISQTEDPSQVIKSSAFYKKIGQLWGVFNYQDSIYQRIWNKYFEKYSNYYQSMLSLNEVKIEANPGTVVYIKESKDSDFNRHVIGETCLLDIKEQDSVIDGIYFAGMHLDEATSAEAQRDILPSNKFVDTGITLNRLEDTSNLIRNGVYTLSDAYLQSVENHYVGTVLYSSGTENRDTVYTDRENSEAPDSLILENLYGPIDENGKVVISENDIEHVEGSDRWTGKYYIDGTENAEDNTQVNVPRTDIPESGNKVFTGEYFFSSKAQYPQEDAASVAQKHMELDGENYTLSLNAIYNQYYNLIINKEIDREFALLLQEFIDESDSRYIWYNNKWWVFTNNNDVLCPIEALIDYYCEVVKGRYNIW